MTLIKLRKHLVLDFCTKFLQYFGFFVPSHIDSNFYLKTSFLCYTTIVITFLLGIYVIVQVIFLYQVWGNIDLMMASSFLLLTNSTEIFKISYNLYQRKNIKMIIKIIKGLFEGVDSLDQELIIHKHEKEIITYLIIYVVFSNATTLGWAIAPLARTLQYDERVLPLEAWYPYDKYKSPMYELSYAHQSMAIILAANTNVMTDMLYAAIISQTCCHLDLLSYSLRNLISDKDKCDIAIYEKLKKIVKQHQDILGLVKDIEKTLSPCAFVQFAVSIVIICATLYQINVTFSSSKLVDVIAMVMYLMAMVVQVFMYCYYGNELMIISTKVSDAAYHCRWYGCSKKFKKALRVIQFRSQQPLKLTAGSFVTLSLETFTGILKASYSYFTVLSKVNE